MFSTYKLPEQLVLVDRLPTTVTGKSARARLKAIPLLPSNPTPAPPTSIPPTSAPRPPEPVTVAGAGAGAGSGSATGEEGRR